MMYLFHEVSRQCSRITAKHYSTSFSSAIKLLHKSLQPHIYNIYGFVRFADEIVDTFHEYDKNTLLSEFRNETFAAIERGVSINPILHSFQLTVNHFNIDPDLIDAFLNSMELDLRKQQYDAPGYTEYIYGSAETVSLMCLHVFCEND
ncbi:MAG TPA: squalene/phytoene synthase family protein, partial [Chitinophagaceae bacterium]